jgi:hypothetical protein
MEKLSSGLYRCKVCHQTLDIRTPDATPLSHFATAGGGPMYRVVTIGGRPVHQCRFPPPDIWHDETQR